MIIENPILTGFNPDPSILRVGDDYWIATSTFEWLPGIQLHRSRDLVHWHLAGHALERPSQIDLAGIAPSKGVWAPALSRDPVSGTIYLCYSLVRNITDNFFDLDNFLVTAPSPEGPWSDPFWLNASGFDPSLFFDHDGHTWLVNLEWDFRVGYEHPGAIVLQEFSPTEGRLLGDARRIYRGGSGMGCLEGPHLFRRGDWYYLLAAEGGTGYGHGVTMARSRRLEGPWEADPANPILTSIARPYQARGNPAYLRPEHFNPDSYLQKSGHGSLVETPDGEAYLVHLCARPARQDLAGAPTLRCVLGRETAIQRMEWTSDGWLRLAPGGSDRLDASGLPLWSASGPAKLASRYLPGPALPPAPWPAEAPRDDFGAPALSPHWASPRGFATADWANLSTRPGWLGLRGRQSLFSGFDQSLVAQRIQHFDFRAATRLEFQPDRFQQMAGLVCLYDTMNYLYLRLYWSESLGGPALGILRSENGKREEMRDCRVLLPAGTTRVRLKVEARNLRLQFSWKADGDAEDSRAGGREAPATGAWAPIGPAFDETRLSDEFCTTGEFTGAFVGLCCQDLAKRAAVAWFDWFDYAGDDPRV